MKMLHNIKYQYVHISRDSWSPGWNGRRNMAAFHDGEERGSFWKCFLGLNIIGVLIVPVHSPVHSLGLHTQEDSLLQPLQPGKLSVRRLFSSPSSHAASPILHFEWSIIIFRWHGKLKGINKCKWLEITGIYQGDWIYDQFIFLCTSNKK